MARLDGHSPCEAIRTTSIFSYIVLNDEKMHFALFNNINIIYNLQILKTYLTMACNAAFHLI